MGSHEAGACQLFGRGITGWTAFLAATTLLAAGMIPVSEAAARQVEAGLIQTTTGPPTEVASTSLATAAELPGAAQAVALTASTVFVQTAGDSGSQVWWRERSGGEWSSSWGGTELAGELVAAESDVVHLRQGENEILAWTRDGGGSRAVPTGTSLGRGAQYIGYFNARLQVAVQPVASAQDLPLPAQGVGTGEGGIVVVGDDVVAMSGSGIRVFDIPTARPIANQTACPQEIWRDAALSGAGSRLVLASCGPDGDIGAVDIGGVYTRFVPAGSLERGFLTGEAFALGRSATSGDLTVVPALSGSPAGGSGTLGPTTSFDLDDRATAVAFVDAVGDVRTADLSPWSSELATEIVDTTAPSATANVSGMWSSDESVLASRSYSASMLATDAGNYPYKASGVASGELRFRQKLAGQSTFGNYVIAASSTTGTHPAGSTSCWSARAVDRAGNQGAWGSEQCVAIDGARPTVTTTALPARVKATETATPVTFKYSARDNGKVATYDVRYHKDKGGTQIGSWVYPRSGTGITARSFTVGTGKSYRVCFSMRARDAAGNVSGWTSSRCTYVDGMAPKVTKATMSTRWLAPITADEIRWKPRFSFGASDDQGVAAYQFEERYAGGRTRLPSVPSRYLWDEVPGTSARIGLDPGDQLCRRVRAKDQVGNIGSWSSWKCVNAPFMTGDRYMTAADTGNFGATVTSRFGASTKGIVAVRSVRVKVQTGPGYGAMKVYAGSEYLGTVNAYASKSGTAVKTLTTSSGKVKAAKVRFVAKSTKSVKVRAIYFVR
ncbi:hypothetical protein ACFS27_10530 [Promicromonospora vindobonensis]|uniref:Fibronectin type-III domain-containing protein n=1 Tax=Promicromonospora vindobonensis TaxID=195748 RepID=A0ABW5VRN5_9MICO